MRLREVQLSDVDAYVRMRCDPVMMAELGGPLPPAEMAAKVRRDVEAAASGHSWIFMILDDSQPGSPVAGTVVLWPNAEGGEEFSEIGWMVLPEFQGRGLAKAAARAVLERAREQNRWGPVHAFPGVTNAASNAICRSVGFTLVGQRDITFNDRLLRSYHWRIDPASDLRGPPGSDQPTVTRSRTGSAGPRLGSA